MKGFHLLQGGDKGLELDAVVFHEKETGQDEVVGAPIGGVAWVLQKGKVVDGMVLQDVVDGIQLQEQLPTHVPHRQLLCIRNTPFGTCTCKWSAAGINSDKKSSQRCSGSGTVVETAVLM
jgi:hypothetical protein